MNVLIFVMTMLLLLAAMTYARLDTFRGSQAFQTVFKDYMEKEERELFNVQAKPTYDSITVNTGNGGGKSNPKVEGSPRLGIALLLDKTKRESKSKEWDQTRLLLKNLIETLYAKQPFYQAAVEKRPSLPDDLINAITHAIDELPKEKKLKKPEDLANLKLDDPELDLILYKILQESPSQKIVPEKNTILKNDVQASVEPEIDISQSDPNIAEDGQEHRSIEGHFSLLDFLTEKGEPKIRVYLAPREVLEAIFHNPQTVDAIITTRRQLHNQARGKGDTKELSASFKDQFERSKDPSVDAASLSFDVTTTNPKNYE